MNKIKRLFGENESSQMRWQSSIQFPSQNVGHAYALVATHELDVLTAHAKRQALDATIISIISRARR